MNSPLLVLTNQVYARKKDGLFYPGSVESKNNDGYAVRFMDDTKERVMEANMTWMGFWDLPPWCWPKNPLVNISASIGKPSDKRVDFAQGYQDFKQQRPDSLTVVGNNDKEGWMAQKNSEQTQLLSKTRCPCTQQRLFVDRQGAAAQRKMEDKKQPSSSSLNRSSVLRLNKKALARDLSRSLNAEASFYPPKIVKQPKNTAVLSPLLRSVPTPELVRTAERPHINNRQFTTAKVDKISSDEADHEAFEYKCRPKRHEIWRSEKVEEECDEKMAKYHDWNGRQSPYSLDHPQKLQTFDWHNASHFDHVLLTPPMTPSNLAHAPSELELPAFGHGTRPTRFIGRDWEQLDTIPSAPISSKGRKRGGMKKCRKVYGAVNRHLWCTQCRWKKACRRFSSFTMETHFKPYLD